MAYPTWTYFPVNQAAPGWVPAFLGVVATAEQVISTEKVKTGLSSNAVLERLRPGLEGLDFLVEGGAKAAQRIHRPVLFGENGKAAVAYEIDAFHEQDRIVVEVEAGRGAKGNAEYRDLIRTSLIVDADFLALLLPLAYRHNQGGKEVSVPAYRACRDLLDAVYASQRLQLPFTGVLLVGY